MKKPFREQPLPRMAGLFHGFRPTPLAFALFWLFPAASQAALGLPSLQIDPVLLQPAPKAIPAPKRGPVTAQPATVPEAARPVPPAAETLAAPITTPTQTKRVSREDGGTTQATPKPVAIPAESEVAAAPATPAQVTEDIPLSLKPSRSLTLNPPSGTSSTPVFIGGMRIQGHHDIETEVIGEAELRQWGQVISADLLRYNKPEDEVFAQGNVRIEQKGDITEGPELKLKLASKEGYLKQPAFQLTEQKPAGRGDASILLFEGENQYRMEDARYTTCQAGSDDWYLHASDLEINRTTQVGTASHAYIDFMSVPILYTPWMNFSLNSERKSGLLSPSYGSTVNSGAEFSLPYYWNIAPNRDATITPRFMTKRGMQLKSELRYLDPKYAGTANLEILPNDQLANQDRSFLSLKHNHNLGNGWTGMLNLERASDDNYFRDLSTNIGVTSQINLLRDGMLSNVGAYGNMNWNFSARSQSFQTLQDPLAPIVTPYRRTQVLLNGTRVAQWSGNNLGPGAILALNSELVNFSHPTLLGARRFSLYPSVSLPLTPLYGYITPKIGLHSTSYSFDNSITTQPDINRTLPIFSVDSGLYFERDINLFGSDYQQTLEPRLYYVRAPYRDQSQIPVFDSGDIGFGIPQIFSENRFAGVDRISDANQVTLGVTSRFFEETGIERLRGTLAQRYYLSLPQVTLPGGIPPARKYSDLLASVGGRITNALTLDSLWQYDPELKQTGNFSLTGRYLPAPGKILNVSYRYTPATLIAPIGIKQIDTSAQWPLTGRWSGLARWNHSILDSKNLETLAGLEYNAGCWAFRAVVHSFTTTTSQRSDSIFFQLELNGIGSIGSNPLDVLKRNIYGYTQTTQISNENNITESR
ncbi:organic solvent tolerance protein [Sulfuricella denitrificans skB26]|uniref:LPS-assembly protein LptD n=1 Tax=Sulfuricella denitrificans (strain DSM 22764 / NBRC 105220 / skB26) TaxID=1163617 RepID=S6AJ85_SULDS|nr:LPS-assembly protein LptD [Sulfuricella denitrificans]BAN36361.1 organic solvent tolerance protein [Sulfuricella denitrificans skB26]